ncbi:hypothetical protein NHX12_031869 [Muraenolepis orangiensis]|uniref:Uncharacterized protein n=1 Tax=Muraenolepis orangiensis TaxID=630683 RepID=A0A9Q0IL15_9TELE|nr:hypothetical protein NHX12_031869 [Muraenolepis orangiensis]
MELDPAVILSAILFTVFAIYFASSLFTKKVEAPANKKKKPCVVKQNDEVRFSSSSVSVQKVEPRVEPPPVVQVRPPVVEEVGPVDTVFPQVKVPQEPEPVPEPIKEPEPAPELLLESIAAPQMQSAPEPVELLIEAVTESLLESVAAEEPTVEPVLAEEAVTEPTVEPVLAEEAVTEPTVEPVLAEEAVTEPTVEPVLAEEAVTEPEPVADPKEEPAIVVEPVVVEEPEEVEEEPMDVEEPVLLEELEATPEPEPTDADQYDWESTPEVLPEEASPEDVTYTNMDAEEEERVTFTPGKKRNKMETLMTKEELEEEQRAMD